MKRIFKIATIFTFLTLISFFILADNIFASAFGTENSSENPMGGGSGNTINTSLRAAEGKTFTLKNSIGEVGSFDNLKDVIEAIKDSGEYIIELNSDYKVQENENYKIENKNLTLKSNGTPKTIKKIGIGHILTIEGNSNLKVENIIFDGNYKNKSDNYGGSCFIVEDGGSLELNQGSIIQNFMILNGENGSSDNGYYKTVEDNTPPAIYLKEHSKLTINGATIQNNTHNLLNNGGAILAEQNTNIKIYSGKFKNNRAYHEYKSYQGIWGTEYIRNGNDGGFIYSKGNIEIYGGEFLNNRAFSSGGAIYVEGNLKIQGSENNKIIFKGNQASKYDEKKYQQSDYCMGGAIYALSQQPITIENVEFEENLSRYHGGTLYLKSKDENNTIEDQVKNCTFKNNTGMYQAGAIWSNRKLKLANTVFEKNEALYLANGSTLEGGAIYITKDIEVENCNFSNNDCKKYSQDLSRFSYSGAGGSINCKKKATLINTNIKESYAGSGGALDVNSLILKGDGNNKNEILSCQAGDYGGAINCGEIQAENYIFKNNRIAFWGGAISCTGNCSIKDCEFSENKAKDATMYNNNNGQKEGGAIYYSGKDKSTLVIENSKFTKNISKNGGAIYAKNNLNIKNCEFTENEVEINEGKWQYDYINMGRGGAIFIEKGKLSVDDSKFKENKAALKGGAIGSDLVYQNEPNKDFINEIKNSTFEKNTAKQGGGIYSARDLVVENSKLTENNGNFGGGIFAKAKSEIKKTSLSKNKAVYTNNKGTFGCGGGLYLYNAPETKIESSKFEENNSPIGGGIYLFYKLKTGDETAKIDVKDSEFTKNTADNGGAIANTVSKDKSYTGEKKSPEINIKSSKFNENTVKEYGGAIYYEINQYGNNITETEAYKNLKTDENTIFIKNKSKKGFYTPPENYNKFTTLNFSEESDIAKSKSDRKSLLNNYDVNFENTVKTIIYDCNGGKFSDNKESVSDVYEVNRIITIREAPARKGYKFLYWKGSQYSPGDSYTVTENHTFVAQWEEAVDIKVKKVWKDIDEKEIKGDKFNLKFDLYKNGQKLKDKSKILKAGEKEIKWEKLPKKENKTEIKYTIKENGVDEKNLIKIGGKTFKVEITGDMANGFTVINTLQKEKPTPDPKPQSKPEPKPDPTPEPPKPEPPKPEPIPEEPTIEFKPHEYVERHPVNAIIRDKALEELIHEKYIFGYPEDIIKPEGNMTRAEAVSVVARLQKLKIEEEKEIFKDTKVGTWYNKAINAAYKAGYLEEKEGENFRPDEKITRAELAQLISHIDKKNNKIAPFEDIKGHKYEKAINMAYGNERIKGYPDGTFRPDEKITRAEVASMLNKLYNRYPDKTFIDANKDKIHTYKDLTNTHWAYYELVEAYETHKYHRLANNMEEWIDIIK